MTQMRLLARLGKGHFVQWNPIKIYSASALICRISYTKRSPKVGLAERSRRDSHFPSFVWIKWNLRLRKIPGILYTGHKRSVEKWGENEGWWLWKLSKREIISKNQMQEKGIGQTSLKQVRNWQLKTKANVYRKSEHRLTLACLPLPTSVCGLAHQQEMNLPKEFTPALLFTG